MTQHKPPLNPIRYVMILAVIFKVVALIVIVAALPYLPRNFAIFLIGILAVFIVVQTRLLFVRRKP